VSTDLHERNRIRRYLKISAGLHVGFFLLMAVGEFISPGSSELFQPSVQIDVVALPDLVKAQNQPIDTSLPVKENPPPPPPEPEEKDAAAEPAPKADEPDAMVLKKEKDAQKEAKKALDRLKAQMKKDQREQAKQLEERIKEREKSLKRLDELTRAAILGNQTNQGTSATGDLLKTQNAYFGHITERLRANWALPAYLQGRGLRAVVRMYIGPSGEASQFRFVQSSGDKMFDEYVTASIKRSKFAPPPAEMANGLRNNGLELEFPL
jgi:TonB family protein